MLKWVKFSLVALIGCGFIGMIIYAWWMRDEIRSAQLEPPLVTASELPVKRRPEQPGGMEIPNRDKLVFDLLDNSASMTAPVPAPVDEKDEGVAGSMAAAATATTVAVTPTVVAQPVDTTGSVEEVMLAAPAQPVAAKPAVAAAAPAVETPPVPAVKPTPKAEPVEQKAKGSWGVQLAAVGSNADAAKAAKDLQAKFAPLRSLNPATSKVLSGGATRYRVQFKGLESRAAALQVCDKLGPKQPCFPVQ